MAHSTLHALIVEIPSDGIGSFEAYETAVLPLLSRHGGSLERRLRHRADNGDWVEIHVVRFADEGGFARFSQDEERSKQRHLLSASRAVARLLSVEEVGAMSVLS